MNFRATSTIEEQMNHVRKYAPLLLLNIPRNINTYCTPYLLLQYLQILFLIY